MRRSSWLVGAGSVALMCLSGVAAQAAPAGLGSLGAKVVSTADTSLLQPANYRRCWWSDGYRHCRWYDDGDDYGYYGGPYIGFGFGGFGGGGHGGGEHHGGGHGGGHGGMGGGHGGRH